MLERLTQLRVCKTNDIGERNLILVMLAIFFSDFCLLHIYSLDPVHQWKMIFNSTPVDEASLPLIKVVIRCSVVHCVSARPIFFGSLICDTEAACSRLIRNLLCCGRKI